MNNENAELKDIIADLTTLIRRLERCAAPQPRVLPPQPIRSGLPSPNPMKEEPLVNFPIAIPMDTIPRRKQSSSRRANINDVMVKILPVIQQHGSLTRTELHNIAPYPYQNLTGPQREVMLRRLEADGHVTLKEEGRRITIVAI